MPYWSLRATAYAVDVATYLALVTPEVRSTVTNFRHAATNWGPVPDLRLAASSGSWLKVMKTLARNALICAAMCCMSRYSWVPGVAAAIDENGITVPLARCALMLRNRV